MKSTEEKSMLDLCCELISARERQCTRFWFQTKIGKKGGKKNKSNKRGNEKEKGLIRRNKENREQ